ncbi:zinc-ribbon domain containing protein [Alkaliphilus peptidifermentans]|uniref:CxxC-x17-CxxC domain-containing protein n=1 Tax=Alkaliphilus peptidifermentans DSM 18978 TaxID=1120976 RepID=A0A1G5DKL9_9FIRM|nr:zinc-ribbon domain containing protein [Alkaliphilus peptidifermentans]SCY14968.1 CxxC-x17-CxxC domain-containing protein [Alkaliphilus peptidifermentans DSM 18978]
MYKDKNLNCKDCGVEFAFTASEQEFFAEKGFTNEPGRCPSCRAAKKAQGRNNSGRQNRTQRQMFSATCVTCGGTASVPFQPSGDKPIYCKDCYQPRNKNW